MMAGVFAKRDNPPPPSYDALTVFKGGILFIDGKQTSCELGILSSKASFVSANCLKYRSGRDVDQSPKYEVYISGDFYGPASHYPVENITVHPKYDPATFANNLAILQYNSAVTATSPASILTDENGWDQKLYGQHSYDKDKSQVLSRPVLFDSMYDYTYCGKDSALYKDNAVDLFCANDTMVSPVNTSCQVPYGVVYGVYGSTLYQLGLYSHSVFYGDEDMCHVNHRVSIYTQIGSYWSFAMNVLQNKAYTRNNTAVKPWKADPSYALKPPYGSDPKDAKYVGGDFYARQAKVPQPSSASSSYPSSLGTSSPSSSSSAGLPSVPSAGQNAASISGGLSRSRTIILGICLPLGTILLMIALFFLIKWQKKRSREKAWDPMNEEATYNRVLIENELGGAGSSSENRNQAITSDDIFEAPADDGLPSYTNAVGEQSTASTHKQGTIDGKKS
ncbi:hypothetical protein GGI12_004754 [Dipsacomyces acuminosporus]|nr:hypothetical protein GGI12_004754 [Dipsacomyces acuminosporus]